MIDKTLKQVHHDVVRSIMNAPVNSFFDITPKGSIMSRFSEDMNVIEDIMSSAMFCCIILIDVITTFYLICHQNIWAIVVIPLLFGYAKSVWDYTFKAKRQAVQIMSKQANPITTHQGEIMSGTSTIRAYQTEDYMIDIDCEN